MSWTEKQLQVLEFTSNTCVLAGAGSGKTMTLVELVMRLLEGKIAGWGKGVDITEVLALTYTEKAAREMRERIRNALNNKIKLDTVEKRPYWQRQRRKLDRAQITTIHSFCLNLLRRRSIEASIDTDFRILDQNRDFNQEVRRDILLNWIHEEKGELSELMDYFPWFSRGRAQGIDAILNMVTDHRRTYGCEVTPAEDKPRPVDDYIDQLVQAAGIVDNMIASGEIPEDKKYFDLVRAFSEGVRRLVVGKSSDEVLEHIDSIRSLIKGNWFKAKEAKNKAVSALDVLSAEYDKRISLPIKEKILSLSRQMEDAFEERKRNGGFLDFDDLLLKTKELLLTNKSIRNEWKEKYKIILVDEFQDANRLQADILALLLEPLEEEKDPAEIKYPIDDLKRENRKLVFFGDPKQSIYRFRGAEVSVFNRLKASFAGSEEHDAAKPASGRIVSLDTNFRSQKKLVDFFNYFFPSVMPGGPAYVCSFQEEDIQYSFRKSHTAGPAARLVLTGAGKDAVETRKNEAEKIADYIGWLINRAEPLSVGDDGRRCEYGDVAVLLRRFTHLKSYEIALQNAGIPFYTVRGQGFYQCPEVWHLVNALLYLSDRNNGRALFGALRSPLFCINDETLTLLTWPGTDGIKRKLTDFFNGSKEMRLEGITDAQAASLTRARILLERLSRDARRATPAELVEELIEYTQYLPVLFSMEQGEQHAANVKKFIEIIRNLPMTALCAQAETARYLIARLEDSQDDPEAQNMSEDANAVQIMTVHQAKGLQFPIVIVPDCGQPVRRKTVPVLFGPEDRFAIRFKDPDANVKREPSDYLSFKEEENEREKAEYVRLLYVAATRAQDHLAFFGSMPGDVDDSASTKINESWASWLNDFSRNRPELLASGDVDAAYERTAVACGWKPDVEPLKPLHEHDDDRTRIVNRIFRSEKPVPKTITINATNLTKYMTCPRLYYLENILGMPRKSVTGDHEDDGNGLSPRDKGNIFHFILETLDFSKNVGFQYVKEHAARRAAAERIASREEELDEITGKVLNFLNTDWGRGLCAAAANGGLIQRECPMWMKIGSDDPVAPALVVTGEIDLFYSLPSGLSRLIDYKYALPSEAARYEPQVLSYALALKRSGLSSELEAGLYFAGGESGRQERVMLTGNWASEFEMKLKRMAEDLSKMNSDEYESVVKYNAESPACVECALDYACKSI